MSNDQLAQDINKRLDTFLELFIGDTIDFLYDITPVDTGRMRGSWGVGESVGAVRELPEDLVGVPDSRDQTREDLRRILEDRSGSTIFLVNTARNPDTKEYYPARIDDERELVRTTFQSMADFADNAVSKVAGGTE